MPDAHETRREKMQQKALEEGVCLQRHHMRPIPLATAAIGEADVAVTDLDQAVVGNRDAVRVAAEILQDRLGSSPRRFGVDDPLFGVELIQVSGAALRGPHRGHLGSACQLPGGRQRVEGFEERGAEDGAQRLDGAEEARMRRDPLGAVSGQGPTGDQAMDMEVRVQELIPRVQEHRRGHLAPEGLATELQERLTGCLKHESEQGPFVAQDERVKVMGEGKDRVKIRHGQERSGAGLDPACGGQRLTLGTVAIAARALGVAFEAAPGTAFGMAPELRGATGDDGVEHPVLSRGYPMSLPVGVAREANDIGDFPLGPLRPRCSVSCMGTGGGGEHGLTPRVREADPRRSPTDRRDCAPAPSGRGSLARSASCS